MDTHKIKSIIDECTLKVYPYVADIVFEHGQGSFLWDTEGEKYLDFATGIGVNILGHSHPAVTAAIEAQLRKGTHCGNLYYSEPQAKLVEYLCEVTGYDCVFFSNSGAEANEAAFKVARRWGSLSAPPRSGIVSFIDGWHGRTIAAISASGSKEMQRGFEPLLSGFIRVPTFDLEAVRESLTDRSLGLFFEPILGHGGILKAPENFMAEARRLCDERGALLIVDEVQTGLGRTGSFLRSHGEGVKPDIVTLAKGIAGGIPMGVTLFTREVASVMDVGSHGTTFGGNPLACAAAYEVIKIVSEDSFLAQVKNKGEYFLDGLSSIQARRRDLIKEVRGVGLMSAMIVNVDRQKLLRTLAAHGLLATSMKPNCIRFLPPLTVSKQELDLALEKIDSVLKSF